ncbi:DNA starvation/stationary phase protection protein [Bacillus sp. RG28]|uniref:DNA starvation/stationary phase protection protein n=1 Tax=Gottfriedia endophytica TaxID=2820819 RepID=A0A940NWN2_9BACI|nr:DNA starvation/stationary phase protection protein [Gottfriedia endophytica]MBP0726328.1 DNA starvation/stationary phase protection protein [Gottfriedia endophytica]
MTTTTTKNIQDVLNKQIADWNVLYVKLHNYHWFVKGPHFFTLHEKFEELYNEASTHIDELAELALMQGFRPSATMKEYLEISSITEATGNSTAEEMVQDIINDFTSMNIELQNGMEIAEEIISDKLLAISSELTKHIWMLKAFLG